MNEINENIFDKVPDELDLTVLNYAKKNMVNDKISEFLNFLLMIIQFFIKPFKRALDRFIPLPIRCYELFIERKSIDINLFVISTNIDLSKNKIFRSIL